MRKLSKIKKKLEYEIKEIQFVIYKSWILLLVFAIISNMILSPKNDKVISLSNAFIVSTIVVVFSAILTFYMELLMLTELHTLSSIPKKFLDFRILGLDETHFKIYLDIKKAEMLDGFLNVLIQIIKENYVVWILSLVSGVFILATGLKEVIYWLIFTVSFGFIKIKRKKFCIFYIYIFCIKNSFTTDCRFII